ncbi:MULTISPECIES: alpha/beta hydrolase [Streptomyces]|uniref:alpha/beta hydrolase n=1 Tax=Streptomyces lycopersici TaxID=2974589 RepID=UPI0021D00E0F|nr:alpha/beta hydrolase [Streptomyces sp. NEAU-383]
MQRRRLRLLLAVGVTATAAPALAWTAIAGPGSGPSATPSSAAGKALDPYVKQKPKWKRCDAGSPATFQCATIKVPLDYRDPGGERIDVAISRIRTAVPDKRRGVLLSNPGGPGQAGLAMPTGLHRNLPKSVQEKYDLIGFDPRGVGKSSPVSCGLTKEEQNWLRPYKEETFAKDVAWARDVAKKCKEKAGDKLPHITTRNTARDMDLLRAILGEKKISFLGYSYGTNLGPVYSELFPARVDRFVLDSAVDPGRAWRGMIQSWAEGSDAAFDRWTKWAAERSEEYGLGDTPKKVGRTFWGLVAQAGKKPIEVDGKPRTGDDIRSGMHEATFTPEEASAWVVELKKAAEGKPASAKKLAAFPRSEGAGPAGATDDAAKVPSDNPTASLWTVFCGDNSAAWSRDPESYRQDAIENKRRYPLYGDFASSIKPCAFWDESKEPVTEVNNEIGSLVVQNEWDGQTPLHSAQGLHRHLKGSRMVTVLGGEGHGVYPNDNACTESTVNDYLLYGKLPAKDVICKATAEPRAEPGK